jgi:two-component system, OmpR family, KDP operon response regulator KdpE
MKCGCHNETGCRPAVNIILIRESDRELAALLRLALPVNEWTLKQAPAHGDAMRAVGSARPDVVVVDLDREGGEDFISAIRDAGAVIVVLTHSGADAGTISAFDLGADMVYTMPAAPDVLRARLSAALRRKNKREAPDPEAYVFAGLSVDLSSSAVRLDGEALHLTATERRLLHTLALNAGRIMTHDQLIREVWGEGYEDSHDLLRAYVSALRRVLKDAGLDNFIQTERQLGYWVPRPSPAANESKRSRREENAAVNGVENGMTELRLERERLRAETDRLLAYMRTLLVRAQELAAGGHPSQRSTSKLSGERDS